MPLASLRSYFVSLSVWKPAGSNNCRKKFDNHNATPERVELRTAICRPCLRHFLSLGDLYPMVETIGYNVGRASGTNFGSYKYLMPLASLGSYLVSLSVRNPAGSKVCREKLDDHNMTP
jgi:hypothetical protein